MLLLAGMCALTWQKLAKTVWLVIGIACVALIGLILYNFFKKKKQYDDLNKKGAEKFDYKSEYISLFPANLPANMPAAALTKEVAVMQNRQQRAVYNNAIRDLISKLNSVNNPGDVLCKNINTYGSIMSRARQRYYIRYESGDFIVYDADFMNPKGELVIDGEDLVSYGAVEFYDLGGAKALTGSTIIEIATPDGGRLYLETHQNDSEKLKKLMKGVKQKKEKE